MFLRRVFELNWAGRPAPTANIDQIDTISGKSEILGGLGNLTGVPAASVPVGLTSGGLPAGLQLLAPWNEDERLLDLAELLEQQTGRRHVEVLPPVAEASGSEHALDGEQIVR